MLHLKCKSTDLIAGTSTGSILAAAVAAKIDISKVLSLYETHGKEIFKKNPFRQIPYIGSLLNNKIIGVRPTHLT